MVHLHFCRVWRGPDFFARDSGLLRRGFQALGIESRAVMPGARQMLDEADLIRTDFNNLEEYRDAKNISGHSLL